MKPLTANPKLGNTNGWQDWHNKAVTRLQYVTGVLLPDPQDAQRVFEESVTLGLQAWGRYADAHKAAYGSLIGEDGVLGLEWKRWGLSLRGLLNGNVGPRLDCGTLDAWILDTLEDNGVSTEGL